MSDDHEPISSQYNYIRSRQLEGTFSPDCTIGVWPITTLRIMYGWGCVPESAWPRAMNDDPWPPEEPDGLDSLAKSSRILYYQRIRDLVDCQRSFVKMQPVSAAFEITSQWFDAPNGVIDTPGDDAQIIGSHAVCLLGMNSGGSHIKFVNSWGERWGDKGFGYLPRSCFEQYLVSAWTQVVFPRVDVPANHAQNLCMGYRAVLGEGVHVREIYDPTTDDRLGWVITVQRGEFLDVEDFFVRPDFRSRGYGKDLAEMLRELSDNTGLGIRIWFSHADEDGPAQQKLCASLGLTIVPSGVRWARFKAVTSTLSGPESPCSAARPTSWRPAYPSVPT